MNFHYEHLASIIEQNKLDHGLFDEEFEPIFNTKLGTYISFVSQSMKEYGNYSEEMSRVINCKLYSKTKKIIIGHRYDSLDETRYYIAKIKSRKSSLSSSTFADENSVTDGYLYVSNLKDTDKTIDDILKTRVFGISSDCIKVELGKIPSMVDSGEALENNLSGDISKYWETMLDNTVQSYKIITAEGYEYLDEYKNIFDIFSYQTKNLDYNSCITDATKNKLEIYTHQILHHLLLMYWNKLSYREDLFIGTSNTDDKNKEALIKLFYENIGSENVMRHIYYRDLINSLGISLENIVDNEVSTWNLNKEVFDNFDTYYKHLFYIRRNRLGEDQADYLSTKNKKTLKDLYVESQLKDVIIELITEAKNNYGIGVRDFRKNDNQIFCEVTIDDILQKYSPISEELKKDIVDFRFNRVMVTFNEKTILE